LDLLPDIDVDDDEIESATEGQELIEVVLAPGASLIGETLETSNFRDRYDGTVLALRRGIEVIHERIDEIGLNAGDTLLIQSTSDTVDRLSNNRDFIIVGKIERPDYREKKIPVAIGIVVGVVGLAALNILDIMVAALGGGLLMVLTRCLKPTELYDSIYWDVIFLLAGVIPLGIALEETGGAELLGDLIVASADFLPPIAVLGVFYLLTAFLTNIISNNASVVLMIPVAVEAALRMKANAFAFVLAVTFAASTAFMTPIGYQTNLFVYGPGGYKFTDYVRVGGPMQILFAVVTTLGIAFFWGL
ncbi:MAG: SLC13 family permease, partial [Halobacteria archaeon]|nr:SLC13 family permease [Halobacteria archaeon]